MIAALLIWLTSDDDDLLKLDLVKVPRSQRHYETLDGRMDTAYNDVVLDLGVLERCKCLADDGSRFLRAVHVVVVHHLLVFPLLLVNLISIGSDTQVVHTHCSLLPDL